MQPENSPVNRVCKFFAGVFFIRMVTDDRTLGLSKG